MTPAGIEPATFRIVAQNLNHCATAVPLLNWYFKKSLQEVHHLKTYKREKNTNVKFLLAQYKQRSTITKMLNEEY